MYAFGELQFECITYIQKGMFADNHKVDLT